MPNCIDCYGLEMLMEDNNVIDNFLIDIINNGKPIVGYYDNIIYFNKHFGKAQMIVSVSIDKENKELQIEKFDTHCAGRSCWQTRIVDSIEKQNRLNRMLIVEKMDGAGIAVVNIVNSEVLPSYAPDEVIKMQVVGLPLHINFYKNEDKYVDSIPEGINGQKIIPNEGLVLPCSLGCDSASNDTNQNLVNIRGKVKELYWGKIRLDKNEDEPDPNKKDMNLFLVCYIDTEFGELEINFSPNMVDKNEWDDLKTGSICNFYGVISGDVAIEEYEKGIVKNHENNLRALAFSMAGENPERLRRILANDMFYYSESAKVGTDTADDYIERLKYVIDNGARASIKFATITDIKEGYKDNNHELSYGVGERCLVIRYAGEENYPSIVFIENDEHESIKKIYVSTNPRYVFKIDNSPKKPLCDQNLMSDEDIFNAMMMRAKFHDALVFDFDYKKLCTLLNESEALYAHTDEVMEYINNENSVTEEEMKNIYSYFYTKGMVNTIYGLDWNFDIDACIGGTLSFPQYKERKKNISDAKKIGSQFYKDFSLRANKNIFDWETYQRNLRKSLVCAEILGNLFGKKLINE